MSIDEAAASAGSAPKQGLRRTASFISGVRNLGSSSHSRTGSSPSTMQDLNLIEGWRAVFNTVLRYGMSERSESALRTSVETMRSADLVAEGAERDDLDAMSGVIELVENVKQHGGKQLLAYVRSLLG